ncbi:MAG: alpha/beta hydrolase [Pseudomonadota bacterium]|nr:alpha/beta hydrolase [Pseudomonadota bacterium]
MKKYMLTIFIVLLSLYGLLLAFLYLSQRQMIYHPDKTIATPEQYGLQGFSEQFISSGGERLQLWYHPAPAGRPTVVYYHGNASNLGDRAGIYAALAGQGFGVLALSYRGYGKSSGSPSEQGLYADARAAIAFLATQNIPPANIILYGESLGTGVAVQMATEYPVALLVLQAPYTSVAGRAAEMYPYVPVRLLMKDTFDSIDKIGRVRSPLLIFHGELDTVIPVHHGRALLAAANPPKEAIFFPGNAHNDFDSQVLAKKVAEFYAAILRRP